MDRQQRAQVRHGHELDHKQHEKHRSCQSSQPFVADHVGPLVTVPAVRVGLSRWAHGPMIVERFHRLSLLFHDVISRVEPISTEIGYALTS
ncbi:MAG: hypothetical protein ACJ8CB_14880 [Ktedonobacteraceae bacterium]